MVLRTTSFGPFMGSNDTGHLEVDGCDALDLAREHGTPLWVLSERTIRHNYQTLVRAFRAEYERSRLVYASKANPEPAVVRIAWQEGALVDVVTMGHIELASAAGVPPSALVFNGNSKSLDELRWAAEHGMAYVNVDSLEETEALADAVPDGAPAVRVCIRLALDERPFAAGDPEFAAHWRGAKFGMDEDDAIAAAALTIEHPSLEFAGLHQHFGWPVYGTPYDPALDLHRHVAALEQVVAFALRLRSAEGIVPGVINLGGGYRLPRAHGAGPGGITEAPTAEEYAAAIGGRLRELDREHGLGEPELLLEPGGYLVSDAAVLLASVGLRKRRRAGDGLVDWVFLENTSSYHFVRRLMFDFRHHVVAAGKLLEPPAALVSMAGPICTDDNVTLNAALPELERGDVVAVLDQGAYCESVTSDYCAVPIPAAVLACDGRSEVIRRRVPAREIAAPFAVPTWLVR
jgi:diaminopimelate decarboxylase